MLENSSNTPSRRLGITGLVILIILIAFNGYLIPWQKRVYGDTTPEMIQKTETGFEFFNVHFDVTLYPNYNAPFRYFLDHLKYNISDRFEEDTLSWLVVFFPFLISTFLSHFI
ncbi:MAG TPA: hypothetical protein VD998_04500, partial [Verrucomicrobiae bacterium]|nr:hypothetical protein [Verrucomicrobiae bacterium]